MGAARQPWRQGSRGGSFGGSLDIVAAEDEARFRDLMQAHHSLGAVPEMGETVLRYVAHHHGRWLALLVFSAPALKCRARDRWIGWDYGVQFDRLHLVTNNARFLILPGGPRNLGSRVHSLCTRHLDAPPGPRLAGPLQPPTASAGALRGPGPFPGHRLPCRQLDRGRAQPRLRPRGARLQQTRAPEACVPSSPVPDRAGPAPGGHLDPRPRASGHPAQAEGEWDYFKENKDQVGPWSLSYISPCREHFELPGLCTIWIDRFCWGCWPCPLVHRAPAGRVEAGHSALRIWVSIGVPSAW